MYANRTANASDASVWDNILKDYELAVYFNIHTITLDVEWEQECAGCYIIIGTLRSSVYVCAWSHVK